MFVFLFGDIIFVLNNMKKQTTIASLFLLVAAVLLLSALWVFSPKVVESPVRNSEKEVIAQVGGVVREFMEEAYINENFEKASNSYLPPQGFETFLSNEPISPEEYIEWYVRSVDLASLGTVTDVQIEKVEKITSDEKDSEYSAEELHRVSFYFMKDDGEPVYFGPCCGEEGAPSAEMFTRVRKTQDGYKIFEDLPYRP